MDLVVESLTPEAAAADRVGLVALLQDAVASGASVGFLPPLATAEAVLYWDTVAAALAEGSRVLLVARRPGEPPVGTVQLDLAMRDNGRHRAEVAKLMVHRAARRQGIGRLLMRAAEAEAGRLGRATLHLDTRLGDPSEWLYQSLGWVRAGVIPRWARSADGTLDATVFYYRLLGGPAGA